MFQFTLRAFALALVLSPSVISQDCVPVFGSYSSFACECDANYCDFPGIIDVPANSSIYKRIVSDEATFRFFVVEGQTESIAVGTDDVVVNVDYGNEFQEMFGFGGAFTDSTGINVKTMSQGAQDNFIKSYFAPEGIEYDLCRIPIAGSDFSTRPYSYDDAWMDTDLLNFALEPEDYNYKLPLIKDAIAASSRNILLFGSPWAPPAWMKTNEMLNGTGGLKPEMWDSFSNYLVKFVQAYENEGLNIWGMTPTNEPLVGDQDWAWNACYWNATDMRDWIATSLGPILTAANLRRVKLMILDHNRDAVPWYPKTILEDEIARSYTDGTAVHWYGDDHSVSLPNNLDELKAMFQDKFILYTEACAGWWWEDIHVKLGEWQRAENYAFNILENVNHFATGWVDWNMALDMTGGPNWAGNYVDSPILVDVGNDRFYKQPTFYAMGHFSKFVQPGSIRIDLALESSNYWALQGAAFKNPDGSIAYVLLNTDTNDHDVTIRTDAGTYININMLPKSLETILIQNTAGK